MGLQSEWEATLHEFRTNPDSLCRYPARAIFFRKIFKESFPVFVLPGNGACKEWHRKSFPDRPV